MINIKFVNMSSKKDNSSKSDGSSKNDDQKFEVRIPSLHIIIVSYYIRYSISYSITILQIFTKIFKQKEKIVKTSTTVAPTIETVAELIKLGKGLHHYFHIMEINTFAII